jgi:predicted RNA-binding protein with PUA-like domain
MAYWLMKSEPFKYSWDNLVADGNTWWDGVRNFAARNNLAAMQVGDEALFYHSNEGKACVGIMRISATAKPDPTAAAADLNKDGSNPWLVVQVEPIKPLKKPITLAKVKATPKLATMALITQQRLSVQPVTLAEWHTILSMSD